MKKTHYILLIALLLIASTFYYFNKKGKVKTEENTELRVGYLPIAVGLPLYVANDEGYFKEQGFDVTMSRFTSSNSVANAATSNQIDVFIAASNVVFDVGFVSKKKHKLIFPNPYSKDKNHIADYLLVRDTTQIKTLKDLKGKKIGIFPGSVVKVFAKLILEKNGLSENDYQLVELAPKDWTPALQTGQIDALSAVEPLASQLMKDKVGFNINSGFFAELMPNVPLSSQWISQDFIEKYGIEESKKIIVAMDKAIDFIRNNPRKAKEYLIKYANLRQDIIEDVELNPWKKHNEFDAKEIQKFIDVLFLNGGIQNSEKINDYLIK